MICILLNKHFVNQAIKGLEMENFIEKYFKGEIFSDIEIERTPMGLRIIINTSRPGRIIGAGGRKINELSNILKNRFKIENPQVDVKSIKNPDLDATIVAKQIALSLETGNNYKKMGNLFMKKIMDSGALGVQIKIAGKMGGSKGRMAKFSRGYIKYCGDTAQKLVDYGFAEAETRPGKIGIQVKIMKYFMDTFGNVMTKKDIKDMEKTTIEKEIEESAAAKTEEGKETAKIKIKEDTDLEDAVTDDAEKVEGEKSEKDPKSKKSKKTKKSKKEEDEKSSADK